MLPLEWVNIVPVDKLVPGDFAFLLDQELDKVIVGTLEGHILLAYPNDPKTTVANVQMFDGNALVIRDWQVEVDHMQAKKVDHLQQRVGSITIQNGKIGLVCQSPRGHGYITLPIKDAPPSLIAPARYGFPAWTLIKMNGDEKIVLCEHPAPEDESSQQ